MFTFQATHATLTTLLYRCAFLGLLLAGEALSGPAIERRNETPFANPPTAPRHLAANIEVEPDGHRMAAV